MTTRSTAEATLVARLDAASVNGVEDATEALALYAAAADALRRSGDAPPERVTKEEWRALAEMLLQAKEIGADLDEVRRRFGLDRRPDATTEGYLGYASQQAAYNEGYRDGKAERAEDRSDKAIPLIVNERQAAEHLGPAQARELGKVGMVPPTSKAEAAFLSAYAHFLRCSWDDLSTSEADAVREGCIALFEQVKARFKEARASNSETASKDSAAFELGFRAGWSAAFAGFSGDGPGNVESALGRERAPRRETDACSDAGDGTCTIDHQQSETVCALPGGYAPDSERDPVNGEKVPARRSAAEPNACPSPARLVQTGWVEGWKDAARYVRQRWVFGGAEAADDIENELGRRLDGDDACEAFRGVFTCEHCNRPRDAHRTGQAGDQ